MRRELALAGAALVVSAALLEWASGPVYRQLRGEPLSKPALRSRLAAVATPGRVEIEAGALPDYVANKALHPYLGFVFDRPPGSTRINRFGFTGDSPLRAREPGESVLAVLGGSVALSLPSERLERELARLPRFAGREIAIVKLALPGYKQPQQLLALGWFLALGARFDAVLNLDGFNDIVLPFADNLPAGVDPGFPRLWHLYSRRGFEPGILEGVAELQSLREARARAARRLEGSWLRASAFALALWDGLDRRYERRLGTATEALEARLRGLEPSFQSSGPLEAGADPAALLEQSARLWAESSRQLALLCAANGIEYHHFLQPNQYLEGSKPFTRDELELRVSERYRSLVGRGYPLLRQEGGRLEEAGVAFGDLTGLFATETRAVYSDACCHLNELGYELLISEMVRRMAGG